MKLKEFLSNIDDDTLTDRLILLDKSIMELHQNGMYVVSGLNEIDIINNEITLGSFKNKVDYLKSGYNDHGDKQDILEMCSIGICAYNKFNTFYTNREFISYLIDNLEMYLENGSVPSIMQEYYIDVFARGKVDYLNNFLLKYEDKNGGKGNSRVYTKSTAIGRAFSEKEAAYTNILLLPAILALVILIVVVVYFIFFN